MDTVKIEGVIFDLDGTLLDSTWVWSQIDTDFLKKWYLKKQFLFHRDFVVSKCYILSV